MITSWIAVIGLFCVISGLCQKVVKDGALLKSQNAEKIFAKMPKV